MEIFLMKVYLYYFVHFSDIKDPSHKKRSPSVEEIKVECESEELVD